MAMIPVEQVWRDLSLDRQLHAAGPRDLRAIRVWIAENNERTAKRAVGRIIQMAMLFGQFPKLGRAGQVDRTRGFSVVGLPYIIV